MMESVHRNRFLSHMVGYHLNSCIHIAILTFCIKIYGFKRLVGCFNALSPLNLHEVSHFDLLLFFLVIFSCVVGCGTERRRTRLGRGRASEGKVRKTKESINRNTSRTNYPKRKITRSLSPQNPKRTHPHPHNHNSLPFPPVKPQTPSKDQSKPLSHTHTLNTIIYDQSPEGALPLSFFSGFEVLDNTGRGEDGDGYGVGVGGEDGGSGDGGDGGDEMR